MEESERHNVVVVEEAVEERSLSAISMSRVWVGNTGSGKQQGLENLYCEMGYDRRRRIVRRDWNAEAHETVR